MASLTVGVMRETAGDERRVALVPADVRRLVASGIGVVVETGAGARAGFSDDAYAQAGAELVARSRICDSASLILAVLAPQPQALPGLRRGHAMLGLLGLSSDPSLLGSLRDHGVTAISFDGLPRTLSRAQPMDALTSQANIAGYKAVLLAAVRFTGVMPMLITAAGTTRPARVLILGAGIAGLQAIGTARRLGAVVRAFDVRPSSRDEIGSMGAEAIALADAPGGAGAGGYAQALSEEDERVLASRLVEHVAGSDIVVTTAAVPGRRPPLLVTEDAVKAMGPGSVVIDLSAGPLGGNVAISRPGESFETDGGVIVIGAANLASTVPAAASTAFSHNVSALLMHLSRDGELDLNLDDEITRGVVLAHDGGGATEPTTKDGTG